MNPTVIVCETPDALAERAASDFSKLATEALASSRRLTVALAGGSTPKAFFARLTEEPFRSVVDWTKLWLFWGDERCVPPDHPDSNYGMAHRALLEKLPAPPTHVYRIHGEDPPPQAARDYEKTLRDVFGASVDWPEFDLILLGMGSDGHTASLIPGTSAVQEEKRWVAENVVRSLQTVRVTLTLPVINRAQRVWFMAAGAKKAAAFAKAQGDPTPDCPASLVRPAKGELRWYVDRAIISVVRDK